MGLVAAGIGAATTATVAFGASAINTGRDFDSAMSQISATMGMTSDDIANNVEVTIGGAVVNAGDTFDALRTKAKEMGAETNFSATQAAEGLNILAMSGYDATSSIDMIEDVLHLAAAGSMEMADSAAYIAGSMKGFNDETKDSAYYADLMAKGATLANTSVAQLGEAMSGGAASAAAYGQEADSMTISLLRLAEQGEVGSAASTALAAAMKNLYTPTDQAAGALAELGVAAYDESGKAREFNTVVDELNTALSTMSDEEANAYKQTIFGIQGLDAFNKMTVTSVEKQQEWAEALASASGEAAKQYDTMTDNLQGDIDIWNSALDGFKIALSDELTPSIRQFVQFGSDGLGRITQAFEAGGLSGAMDALGGVLTDGVSMVIEFVPDMIEAGMQLLSALGQGLMDNIDVILFAAGDIAEMLLDGLLESTSNGTGTIMEIIDWILGVFEENYMGLMDVGAQILINIINGIVEALPDLLYYAGNIIQHFGEVLIENLPLLIESAFQMILTLAEGIAEALPDLIPTLIEVVVTIAQSLIENLPLLIEAAITLFLGIVTGLIQALPQIIAALPTLIDSIIAALLDSLPLLIDCGVQLFLALIENLPTIIVSICKAAPEIVKSLVRGFLDLAVQFADTGKKLMEKLKEGITGMLSNLVSAAIDIGKNIVDGIWNGISAGWDWLTDKVGGLAKGLFDKAKSALGIASPSKKFRWLGEMCVAGFDEGAADLMNGTAFGSAVNSTLGTVTANTGFGSLSGYGSQTFNFYDTQTSPDAIRRRVQNTMTFGLAGGI